MTAARGDDTSRQMARAFPSTRWSRILGTGSRSNTTPDVEALALAYWRPVYGFVRARWARTDEEALDSTQDFFLWMLEGGFLERADPSRGRFRGFLKASLSNFFLGGGLLVCQAVMPVAPQGCSGLLSAQHA